MNKATMLSMVALVCVAEVARLPTGYSKSKNGTLGEFRYTVSSTTAFINSF